MQGLGWVLFAASIASIIWLVIQVAAGFAYCVRCWALMTSSFFLSAELVRNSAASLGLNGLGGGAWGFPIKAESQPVPVCRAWGGHCIASDLGPSMQMGRDAGVHGSLAMSATALPSPHQRDRGSTCFSRLSGGCSALSTFP